MSSIVAMLCFNFFFLPPVGTFTIADPQNWVALFAFLATALTASQLSARLETTKTRGAGPAARDGTIVCPQPRHTAHRYRRSPLRSRSRIKSPMRLSALQWRCMIATAMKSMLAGPEVFPNIDAEAARVRNSIQRATRGRGRNSYNAHPTRRRADRQFGGQTRLSCLMPHCSLL